MLLDKYILSEKVQTYVLSSGTKNFHVKPKIDLEVARPLLATMHKMHRAGVDNYYSRRDGKVRKLTPREVFRLQGFPESFKFSVSDLQAYKQAGNAVPINVVEKVCTSVINYLFKNKKNLKKVA